MTMTPMTRGDFGDLKPGDEVAVDFGRYGTPDWSICKVTRLTPSKNIVVAMYQGERIFYTHGGERGGDRYNTLFLTRLSDEMRQKISELQERSRLLSRFKSVVWTKQDTATLRSIVALLDANKDA